LHSLSSLIVVANGRPIAEKTAIGQTRMKQITDFVEKEQAI